MKNYTMILLIGCTLIIFTAFAQVFQIAVGEKLHVWIYESIGFIMITAMVTGASVVFRPFEGSKQLVEVEELLDETLTEIGDFSAR